MGVGIYVITGGPSTGKTSVVRELEKRKHLVFHEASRRLSESDPRFIGRDIREVIDKYGVVEFNLSIIRLQKSDFNSLDGNKVAYSDRGLVDNHGYLRHYKLENKIPSLLDDIRNHQYAGVFVLEHLGFYEKDKFRTESEEEQKQIHERLIEVYLEHGYKPISVPRFGSEKCAGLHPESSERKKIAAESISSRVDFVLKKMQSL